MYTYATGITHTLESIMELEEEDDDDAKGSGSCELTELFCPGSNKEWKALRSCGDGEHDCEEQQTVVIEVNFCKHCVLRSMTYVSETWTAKLC